MVRRLPHHRGRGSPHRSREAAFAGRPGWSHAWFAVRHSVRVRFLARLGANLERFLLLWVVLFAAVGVVVPGPARRAVAHHGVTAALVVLVFAVGLGLPVTELVRARAHTARILVVVLVPAVVLPALAWVVSRLVAPGPLREGVLTAGVAPTEVAAVALAALAGGSAALTAAVLIGSTLTSVVLAGPTMHLLAPSAGTTSTGALLVSLLSFVAVPLTVGIATRAALPPRRAAGADTFSSLGASGAVLILIWLVAGQAHPGPAYLRAGLALLLLLAASTATGALLTQGLPPAVRTSLLLPVAMRDFAIAAGIATETFGPAAAAPLGLYGVLVLLLGAATPTLTRPRPAT